MSRGLTDAGSIPAASTNFLSYVGQNYPIDGVFKPFTHRAAANQAAERSTDSADSTDDQALYDDEAVVPPRPVQLV